MAMGMQMPAARTSNNGAGDGETVIPRFHLVTIEDEAGSAAAGRRVFKDEERVEIIFPGNTSTRPVFKVTQEHIDRWPDKYEKFKNGLTPSMDGVPLEEWPRLKPAQVFELKYLGFNTIEQVAAMNDLAMQRVGMGARGLRDLAQAFLDDAKRNELTEALTAERERNQALIADQQRQIDELKAMCDNLYRQQQAMASAPNPIATHIPGMHDPHAAAMQGRPAEAPAQSSLAGIEPSRRRPGRPANAEREARGT